MNSRTHGNFKLFFAFIDLLSLNLINAVLMLLLRRIGSASAHQYLYLFVAENIIWLLSAYSTILYYDRITIASDTFSKRTLKTFIIFFIGMLLLVIIYHYGYSRVFLFSSLSLFFGSLIISRLILVGVSFYIQNVSSASKKIVILGYNDIARTLVQRFSTQRQNFLVSGYFEDEERITELSTLPIIGNIDECIEYARNNQIQEIYSTISPESNRQLYEMAQMAEKSFIRFKFVPDFKLYVNRVVHMEYLMEIPILSLRPEPLEDYENAFKKRIFDVLFSLLVTILLLSWLLPLIAICIKLTSKGPIFFSQMRSGKKNEEFKCFKFRTLNLNKEAHLLQVTRNDQRITKVGRFLRKTNLDELPQFINVLKGQMSVIGPRPHMLKHTSQFSKIMSEYMIRHLVKPGISGWAQVNGYRGEIKTEEQLRKRIEYDIWYMENWSLWLDLKIIWLTIYSTLKGDQNAY